MTKGLVSIIVPVYNSERFLDQCVSSIVGQSYKALEIILVDDGSRDNSPEICDGWAGKDSRVKVIHKQNAGAGFARNSGLDIADGEFICFVDSDDWMVSDAVEKAYAAAQKENAQIVIFGSTTVDQTGEVLQRHIPHAPRSIFRGEEVIAEFLPELVDGNHKKSTINNLVMSLWTCMFSGELISNNSWRLVSEREYASEDSYSLIALYRNVSCVAILPESLYNYREVGGSLSHSYRKDEHDRMTASYHASTELSDGLGYPENVCRRIAGLFLSQEIGLMKQIVQAKLPVLAAYAEIKRILEDETTRVALSQINWQYSSRSRNLLMWMMRKRLSFVILVMVKAQMMKKELSKSLRVYK